MIPIFPPQHPHESNPDRSDIGRFAWCNRRARPSRVFAGHGPILAAISLCRARTACHRSSGTILSSGTSVLIHRCSGLGRETRFSVMGSLMKRCRFHTSTPAYNSLFKMPVPRDTCPRMVVSLQARPFGPGTRSPFNSTAMDRGLCPAAKARKIRQTTSDSSVIISRSPRTGSQLASSFFIAR